MQDPKFSKLKVAICSVSILGCGLEIYNVTLETYQYLLKMTAKLMMTIRMMRNKPPQPAPTAIAII